MCMYVINLCALSWPSVCRYERVFAGYAHANLCVSEAMKKDLRKSLGIQ